MVHVLAYIAIAFCLLFSACGGGDPVTITEEDVSLFTANKTSNKNYVVYAVETNGECDIVDVWAYWVMAEEDGHTEELLNIEQDYYGVKGFARDGTSITFKVAALDKRTVSVVPVFTEKSETEKSCRFDAYGTIEGEYGRLNNLMIHNHGNSVDFIEVIGHTISEPVQPLNEKVIPE